MCISLAILSMDKPDSLNRSTSPRRNAVRILFYGQSLNRVDVLAGWADPYYGGEAEVRIDGQHPSERPELYHTTRPTDTFSVDWPGVNHIGAEKPLLIENWTLRILEVNAGEGRLRFEVTGSRTGPDGGGVSTERFVSKSGRVVIEPQDWTFARSFALRRQPTPSGFEVTWSVLPMFADVYRELRLEDPTRERATTLALGLVGTKHKLQLIARRLNPPMIRAIRVYRPPIVSLGKAN
jgi:hypothetical protein